MFEEYEGFPVASTADEWAALLKDKNIKVVRCEADWKASFECDPSGRHPLAKCTAKAIEEFTRTLVFNNGGLAHANYRSLRNSLTLARFDQLGAMFGISPGLMLDYNNKECAKRATCSSSITDICTSNC
ncbi:hypothetical protein [Paremcibacter congregatus]|uniref:Uncharacterized protein n=1 Tax=Paremcibacter congregatus TaxID=2043170 RepID=A0A2G4YWH3_9PROT|nr:hypothetical protein [Paremcibacter congregatus]PHZ86669.1 hypothetical protein CRD36_01985 [Paremcibacter congregatus]QDE26470.1 hypothetical protein FIV45_03860 [Paremcibacter congregatus]